MSVALLYYPFAVITTKLIVTLTIQLLKAVVRKKLLRGVEIVDLFMKSLYYIIMCILFRGKEVNPQTMPGYGIAIIAVTMARL